MFIDCLPETLRDAPMDLARDQQGIDDVTAVVHCDIAENLDFAGFPVDLRNCDVRPKGKANSAAPKSALLQVRDRSGW